MSTLDAVLSRIDQDIDQSVERLFALLRIASVSTDPAYKEQCRAAAEHVAADLKSIGFETKVRPTEGHPVVVGKSNGASGPRVLFYGHYDVQPVDPLNLWKTPPFEPRIETLPGGRKIIVARGACDDKGQAMTFIEACRAFKAVTGKLPLHDHHHDRGRGGVRLAEPVQIRARQRRRVQARPRAGLRHRHVGRADAGRHHLAARAGL